MWTYPTATCWCRSLCRRSRYGLVFLPYGPPCYPHCTLWYRGIVLQSRCWVWCFYRCWCQTQSPRGKGFRCRWNVGLLLWGVGGGVPIPRQRIFFVGGNFSRRRWNFHRIGLWRWILGTRRDGRGGFAGNLVRSSAYIGKTWNYFLGGGAPVSWGIPFLLWWALGRIDYSICPGIARGSLLVQRGRHVHHRIWIRARCLCCASFWLVRTRLLHFVRFFQAQG